MTERHVLVLAAGKGTRMRSSRPKVLHRLAGSPLVEHVLRAADPLGASSTTLVVGHQAEVVERELAVTRSRALRFVRQDVQLGTAHAVLQAEPALAGKHGTLIVLMGDAPLVSPATTRALAETHERAAAAATVLTATIERPYGYGRIVRHAGQLAEVVEEADATPEQRTLREVNSGIYAFDLAPLFPALRAVPAAGPGNERYLPGILRRYSEQGLTVETVIAADHEIRGINSRHELAEAGSLMRHRKNEELMAAGVTIVDPATAYVDVDVEVGPDTVIHPGVILEGRTSIGARCELHAGVRIVNSVVGDDVTVNNHSVIIEAEIAAAARVGPFAHLRPGSAIGAEAKVGNFVEIKKATLGAGSKAGHLSYLGDAAVGAGANIGAGTITCNFDGAEKHRTTIGDEVFVGSGTQLVAPVTIEQGAYVAAGSCITEDVPAGALAVARGRQVNKEGRAVAARKDTNSGRG